MTAHQLKTTSTKFLEFRDLSNNIAWRFGTPVSLCSGSPGSYYRLSHESDGFKLQCCYLLDDDHTFLEEVLVDLSSILLSNQNHALFSCETRTGGIFRCLYLSSFKLLYTKNLISLPKITHDPLISSSRPLLPQHSYLTLLTPITSRQITKISAYTDQMAVRLVISDLILLYIMVERSGTGLLRVRRSRVVEEGGGRVCRWVYNGRTRINFKTFIEGVSIREEFLMFGNTNMFNSMNGASARQSAQQMMNMSDSQLQTYLINAGETAHNNSH